MTRALSTTSSRITLLKRIDPNTNNILSVVIRRMFMSQRKWTRPKEFYAKMKKRRRGAQQLRLIQQSIEHSRSKNKLEYTNKQFFDTSTNFRTISPRFQRSQNLNPITKQQMMRIADKYGRNSPVKFQSGVHIGQRLQIQKVHLPSKWSSINTERSSSKRRKSQDIKHILEENAKKYYNQLTARHPSTSRNTDTNRRILEMLNQEYEKRTLKKQHISQSMPVQLNIEEDNSKLASQHHKLTREGVSFFGNSRNQAKMNAPRNSISNRQTDLENEQKPIQKQTINERLPSTPVKKLIEDSLKEASKILEKTEKLVSPPQKSSMSIRQQHRIMDKTKSDKLALKENQIKQPQNPKNTSFSYQIPKIQLKDNREVSKQKDISTPQAKGQDQGKVEKAIKKQTQKIIQKVENIQKPKLIQKIVQTPAPQPQPPKAEASNPTKPIKQTQAVSKQQDSDSLSQIDLDTTPKAKETSKIMKPPQLQRTPSQLQKNDPVQKDPQKNKPTQSKKSTDAPPPPKLQITKLKNYTPQQIDTFVDNIFRHEDVINSLGEYPKKAKNIYNQINFDWAVPAYYLYRKFSYERNRLKQSVYNKKNNFTLKNLQVPVDALKKCLQHEDVQQLKEDINKEQSRVEAELQKLYQKAKSIDKTVSRPNQADCYMDCRKCLSKQYKFLVNLQKTKPNSNINKRQIYVMELLFLIQLLGGNFIKDYEQQSQIKDFKAYLSKYTKKAQQLLC